MPDPVARCAVHPARPAADECPVCQRPRCAADAADAPGGGCAACRGVAFRAGRPPLDARALVRAGIAGNLLVWPAGEIASQYVDTGTLGHVVPVLLGVLCGVVVEAAARRARGLPLRLAAVGYALLVTAYGFVRVPGRLSPVTPFSRVWWPYLGAALGAWLWTMPPRRRTRPRGGG